MDIIISIFNICKVYLSIYTTNVAKLAVFTDS